MAKSVNRLFNFTNFRKLCKTKYYFHLQEYSTTPENPYKKTFNIIADDFKKIKNSIFSSESQTRDQIKKYPAHCDILVIGGGAMGSSVAYWLKQRALDGLDVVVLEKDMTVNFFDFNKFQKSTTVLSVGGLRQQFSLKENIELSMYSADFFRNIKEHLSVQNLDPPDIQFNHSAYTFLASDSSAQILKDNVDFQRSLGAKVELLSPEELKTKFPWMNTEGIALGSHGLENEGWFDPWSLLNAFRLKAIDLGAKYIEGEAIGFDFKDRDEEELKRVHVDGVKLRMKSGEERSIKCAIVIIACGPHSGKVGDLAGMGHGKGSQAAPLPVEPRKRYVYNIHCPKGPGMNCPLVIDPSGAYFRREGLGGNYLCGKSPLDNEEPSIHDLEVDYDYFETHVWPIIAARCPAFENAKLKSAWAGYYDFNSFDENAFIGPHPGYFNIYLATGFSGHGIQQSPGVGRAIMELIIDGEYKTIDLTRFHFDRYLLNEPLWESNIV